MVSLIIRRKRQEKINQQLSNMMEELHEARQSSAQPQDVTDGEEQKEYLTKEDKQFLKKLILEVTQQMYHKTVTVTQIADKMCMSPKTLNRRVQYLTGEGTKRYITRIQLEQARIMLLRDMDVSIMEIGIRCGFDDHSSFTRTFSNYFGMSPSTYRNSRGKG
jgi:transcriptional regulator GlxA family with amidase domain